MRGIALRTIPNISRTNKLNPLQDVHPSQQVMVTPWFNEKPVSVAAGVALSCLLL